MDPVNLQAKFEIRSFTRSWDNSGYLKKLWAVPGYAVAGRSRSWFWYQSKVRIWLPISPW